MHIIFSFCLVHSASLSTRGNTFVSRCPPFSDPPGGQCQPTRQISIEQCGAVKLCTDVFTRTRGLRIQMQCENTDPPFNPKTTKSVLCSETWALAKNVSPLRATCLACIVHFLGPRSRNPAKHYQPKKWGLHRPTLQVLYVFQTRVPSKSSGWVFETPKWQPMLPTTL